MKFKQQRLIVSVENRHVLTMVWQISESRSRLMHVVDDDEKLER